MSKTKEELIIAKCAKAFTKEQEHAWHWKVTLGGKSCKHCMQCVRTFILGLRTFYSGNQTLLSQFFVSGEETATALRILSRINGYILPGWGLFITRLRIEEWEVKSGIRMRITNWILKIEDGGLRIEYAGLSMQDWGSRIEDPRFRLKRIWNHDRYCF